MHRTIKRSSYEKGRPNGGGKGLAAKLIKPLTCQVLGSDFNNPAWNAECTQAIVTRRSKYARAHLPDEIHNVYLDTVNVRKCVRTANRGG